MLFVMIVMGITQGMQPIVGYNFGAKQYERVRKTLRYAITAGVLVMTVGFILSEIFPHAIVALFTTSEELVGLSVVGLRISCAMFPFVGCQIVISNFFQVNRPGPGLDIPFVVEAVAVPVAAVADIAQLLVYEWGVVEYAYLRLCSLCDSRGCLDDSSAVYP